MKLEEATASTTDDLAGVIALTMTLIALAGALCVTAYTSTRSDVGIAASKMSTASCIRRPCASDARHRDRSRSSPNQRQDGFGEPGHGTDSLLSLTDTSPPQAQWVTRGSLQ